MRMSKASRRTTEPPTPGRRAGRPSLGRRVTTWLGVTMMLAGVVMLAIKEPPIVKDVEDVTAVPMGAH